LALLLLKIGASKKSCIFSLLVFAVLLHPHLLVRLAWRFVIPLWRPRKPQVLVMSMSLTWIAILASLLMGVGALLIFILAVKQDYFRKLEENKYQVFWSDLEELVEPSQYALINHSARSSVGGSAVRPEGQPEQRDFAHEQAADTPNNFSSPDLFGGRARWPWAKPLNIPDPH
jgi:hypothetical protein